MNNKPRCVKSDSELKKAQALLLDMFNQSCQYEYVDDEPHFSHDYISVYEAVQDYLIEIGLINQNQCKYP